MAENPTNNTISSIDHIPAGERGKNFPPFDKSTFASQLVWFVIFFVPVALIILLVIFVGWRISKWASKKFSPKN